MSKRVLNLVREVLREQKREADYDELYYGLQDIEALLEVSEDLYQLPKRKPKRKLSAWNKFVKANANKKRFQYANGKLKLKKMGIAYRKRR